MFRITFVIYEFKTQNWHTRIIEITRMYSGVPVCPHISLIRTAAECIERIRYITRSHYDGTQMRASCFEHAFTTHIARKIELEAASYDQYLVLNGRFWDLQILRSPVLCFKCVLVNIIVNILTY